jgi:pimeloyl-ACP methyl ester carboxylesterase
LGYNEWKDVDEVVNHLRSKEQVTGIALWGRSMGAVTALRYISKHPEIAAGIYDSPFKNLKSLVSDIAKRNTKIPSLIVSGLLKVVSGSIKEKAKFNLYDLNPLDNEVPNIEVPGFFIVGE